MTTIVVVRVKGLIMRFFIPFVFYEITNVQGVYWSDITIFIGRM